MVEGGEELLLGFEGFGVGQKGGESQVVKGGWSEVLDVCELVGGSEYFDGIR